MHHETAPATQTGGRVIHWARWYDRLHRVMPFMRAVQEELVALAAPAAGEHVLDVGCGTGELALALSSRVGAGEVHGIDASREMIEVAKGKVEKAGVKVNLQMALIEALPFPDASFDLVTSSLMLHHLPDDLKPKGLEQIRRVLKPGGRFMAMDFAAQGHGPLGHLLSVLGHARGDSTVDKLTRMLREAGFGEVEVVPTRHTRFAFIRAR